MLKVGLTGGIACGKSVVRRRLADKGFFTLDADAIVHGLMGSHSELSQRIGEEFGAEVLAPDGSVDRKKLGAIVFSDREAREQLNHLVHPLVISEKNRLLTEAERQGAKIAVVDAALMIEKGTYRDYDCLIVVYCPKPLQIQRLIERDALSREAATRRVEAQLPAKEKKAYADYVIDTSGSLAQTRRHVDEIWRQLDSRAR